MPFKYKFSEAVKHAYEMLLPITIEQNGKTIKIGEGPFTISGERYVLGDDWEWDLPVNRPHNLIVIGVLVKDRATNEIQLMVDECWEDGQDELFEFANDGPFILLDELFNFRVRPEDGNDLNKIDIQVYRSKEPPPRPIPPEVPPLDFPEG